MNILTLESVFRLRDGVEVQPFDSKLQKRTYLVIWEDRNFKVSGIIYRIIKLIDGTRSVNDILSNINNNGNHLSEEKILEIFSRFLLPYGVVAEGGEVIGKKKTHLYVKYSIFTRDSLYNITYILKNLFSKPYSIIISILLAMLVLYLLTIGEVPTVSLIELKGVDLVLLYLILYSALIFHELGHLSACHYYNVKYKELGIGIYLYFLVFYSDISKTWKLNMKQRIVVDLGGIYFQLMFMFFLYLLFVLYKSIVFIYAIHLTILSILLSLNPFFKFDGYWIASDFMGIPNLRNHVYAYIKNLLSGKKSRHSNDNLTKRTRYNFIAYIILSNLFFIFNLFYIIKAFSLNFNTVYSKIVFTVRDLNDNFYSANILGLLNDLNNLFPYLILLLSFSIMIIVNMKKLINLLKKYYIKTVLEVK